MLLDLIVGARPNFIKIAPLTKAIDKAASQGADIAYRLIHTGQHYDTKMSKSFFAQLEIPEPDVNFGAGGGTQAAQTASIMLGYEKYLEEQKPDLTIVVGDVTSTMACTIVAKKAGVPVAHIEAGIRSGDMTMPEEINRILTDSITDYFFTTTPQAGKTLQTLGVSQEKIFFVGNIMIDTLRTQEPKLFAPSFWEEEDLHPGSYIVLTLHRPSNVDDATHLEALLKAIAESTKGSKKVIIPVHPRAASKIKEITTNNALYDHFIFIEPLSYQEFNYMVKHSVGVITDSGGITEETTVFGVPCITLRTSTERPETITIGTNELLGIDPAVVPPAIEKLLAGHWKKGGIPELWDGQTAGRIVEILLNMASH